MAYNEFGLWLDRRMEEAGVTSQSELGRRIGRSHAAINRWMNGVAEPTPQDAMKVSRVLGVSELSTYQALGWLPKLTEGEWHEWEHKLAQLNPAERSQLSVIAGALLGHQGAPQGER